MSDCLMIFTDFGVVPCGTEPTKTIELKNETNKIQELVVDERTVSKDNRFRIHPLEAVVLPNHSARFVLTYKSNEEDITSNFYYDVSDSEKFVARLAVRAQSEGPFLSPCVFHVKFFKFRDVCQTSKNVEVGNTAGCKAKFWFDMDEESQVFEVSQRNGTINEKFKLGLKLTFNPTEPGIYYRKLFCIVQYHPPIIFNVLGIYLPKVKVEPKNLTIRYPPAICYTSGYEEYMDRMATEYLTEEEKIMYYQNREDILRTPADDTSVESENGAKEPQTTLLQLESKFWSDNPTAQIFLTKNFIDLKNLSEAPKAIALVNISNTQIYYYEWSRDPKRHFLIDPSKGLIEPHSKVFFSIYFSPSVLDYLFHAELEVKIYPCSCRHVPENSQIVDLPLTESLKVIGNSFPNDSCGWIAQCRITPKSLHLRSCVPGEKVFGTFMIERQGHLPFTFVFVPPKDSNFTIQPPLGYLSKDFQLFVVHFLNDFKEPGFYTEDFKIKFNNSEVNMETLRISISVEKPTLMFGENNSLTFNPIFPGSKLLSKVSIENPTNLHISFEFKVQEDVTWTEVLNPTGIIEPKSFGEAEFIFHPDTPCEYMEYIPCWVSSTSKMDLVEVVYLQLMGSCQYGYLIATPSVYNFGESSYKDEKSLKVTLFNFSPVLLFFHLSPHGVLGDAERDVKITPVRGCVPAKGSIKTLVTITPHDIDTFSYEIICQNSVDDSEDAEPCEDPRPILSLKFQGVLPTFQIIDISTDNSGPLFSPHWLWKMFSIDKLNEALNAPQSQEPVRFILPNLTSKSLPMSVSFLLEASRHGEISWDFSVDVTCSCISLDIRQDFQCFHCSAISVDFIKTKLLPKERVISTIHVHQDHLQECTIEVMIRLPHGRMVSLMTVPCGAPFVASFYLNPVFQLKPVFVGDVQPPLQLFWIYNNDDQPVSYMINNVALRSMTPVHGIFDCINPSGVLPPFSSTPIAFIFRPNEIISYLADVRLNFQNNESKTIHLRGEGTLNRNLIQELGLEKTIPKIPKLISKDVAVVCYECVIDIHFFRVFSQVKRNFYLVNTSETKVWAFRWHSFQVENIFAARVEPPNGSLKPGEKILMTMILKSYSHPTSVSFSIPCDVMNYSKLKAYEQSVRIRDMMAERYKDYFTITEKGESEEVPDFPVSEEPKSYHVFLTVNANIVSNINVEQNLPQGQQQALRAVSSIPCRMILSPLQLSMRSSVLMLLEKILWGVVESSKVEATLENLKQSQHYTYLQILPEVGKKKNKFVECLKEIPDKNYLQRFLESRVKEVVCKKLISEDS